MFFTSSDHVSNCAKSVIPNQLFRLDPTTASQLAARLSHPSQHQSSLEWSRSSFFRLYLSASSSPHPHRHQLPFTNGSSCSLHSRGPSGMSRRSRSRSRGPRLGSHRSAVSAAGARDTERWRTGAASHGVSGRLRHYLIDVRESDPVSGDPASGVLWTRDLGSAVR